MTAGGGSDTRYRGPPLVVEVCTVGGVVLAARGLYWALLGGRDAEGGRQLRGDREIVAGIIIEARGHAAGGRRGRGRAAAARHPRSNLLHRSASASSGGIVLDLWEATTGRIQDGEVAPVVGEVAHSMIAMGGIGVIGGGWRQSVAPGGGGYSRRRRGDLRL